MANFKDKPVEERIEMISERFGLKDDDYSQTWMEGEIEVKGILDNGKGIYFYHGSNKGRFCFKYEEVPGRQVGCTEYSEEYHVHTDICTKNNEGKVPEDQEHRGYLYIPEDSQNLFKVGNRISFDYVCTIPFKGIDDDDNYFIPKEDETEREIIRTIVRLKNGIFAEMMLCGMKKADENEFKEAYAECKARIEQEIDINNRARMEERQQQATEELNAAADAADFLGV